MATPGLDPGALPRGLKGGETGSKGSEEGTVQDAQRQRSIGVGQSAKQQDLEEVVARCNAQSFTAPDGRLLRFGICSTPGHI